MPSRTRRHVVAVTGAGVATAMLPGCLGNRSRRSSSLPDVVVFNDTSEDATATVTVSPEGSDDPLVDDTPTIVAREAAEYPDALPSSGTFTLAVDARQGPTASATRSLAAESASLQAVIEPDAVRFRVRGTTPE